MTKRQHHKLGIALAFIGVGFMAGLTTWGVSLHDVSAALIGLGSAGMQLSIGLRHMESYEDAVRQEYES